MPSPENLPLGQTTAYNVQIVHAHIQGIVASPIAGDAPQNASLVRLHAPMEFIDVYWSGTAEGKPPILPSHKSYLQNYNRVFLGGERVGIVTPAMVGHYWVVAGVFRYVVVGPEGLDSAFPLAKCPWEGTAATDFYVPKENFVKTGIINPLVLQPIGLTADPDAIQLSSELVNPIAG